MLRRWLQPTVANLFAGVAVAVAVTGSQVHGFASDLPKDTSLRLAPKDADFYSSSLLLSEQWARIAQSEFAKELLKSEWIQSVIDKGKSEWESGSGQAASIKMAMNTPLVQDLMSMAKEMVSDEFFVLGDNKFSKMLVGVNSLQKEAAAIIQVEGPEAIKEWFASLEKEDFDEIPVPTIVMGFKVQNQERVLSLLDQLQGIVSLGMNAIPQLAPLADGFERAEDPRGTRLVLTLSEKMIPWDDLPATQDDELEMIEKLQELLEGRQLAISIGLLDQYVVIGLSESGAKIAELGERGSLIDNPQLKPLMEKSKEKIVGISFVSDAFSDAQFQNNFKNYFSNAYGQMQPALELLNDGELPEFLEPLEEDLKWLDEKMAAIVPEFKGSLGFSYFTSKGQEGYNYSRSKSVVMDGSKNLEVLQHCGGEPIAMIAMRGQYHPEWFQLTREIAKKAHGYLEGLLESEMLDEGNEHELELFLDKGWPVLKRIADVVESKFIPATKDGQHAWILSAGNLQNKKWIKEMPESKELLPLPEFGTVASVSDQPMLINGFVELFGICDSVVDLVRELHPDSVPAGYSVPRPVKNSQGRYVYPIPDDCPVPKEMAPQATVEEKWLIATYSDKQSSSLNSTKKLAVGQGIIDPSKPMAAASYWDLGAMAKLMTPWVKYGLELQFASDEGVIAEQEGMVPEFKVKDALQIWNAMTKLGKGASSTQVEKDGSTVTHWSYAP